MGLFDGTALERPVLCDSCGLDVKECSCPPVESVEAEPEVAPEKQSPKLRIEKRKKGKTVTVVAGLRGSTKQRQELLTKLKNECGAGGTLADGNIEIQGNHLNRLNSVLRKLGFRIK